MTDRRSDNRFAAGKSLPRSKRSVLRRLVVLFFAQFFIWNIGVSADEQRYELAISKGTINLTGAERPAMLVNGGVPGPTLRFTEGDRAVITVHNKMDVETSVHWHGLLLPNNMDGVPNVTYPPIAPGTSFTYTFDLRQSGTYWYHSHTMLQEQQGVYGAFVIEPRVKESLDHIQDYVVVLSDWTDEDPHTVLHTLKRGSEWYSVQKGTGQSILGAARMGMLPDYFSRELQRMPPMDLSDIYYERFLINGLPERKEEFPGLNQARLRVINGSSSTFFYLEVANGEMEVVSADGLPVVPFKEKRLLIGVAETYDLIVPVPKNMSHEFRATAHDGSGHASLWLGTGAKMYAPNIPKANLYAGMGDLSLRNMFALTPGASMGMSNAKVDAGLLDKPGMAGMGHGESKSMDHDTHGMDMSEKMGVIPKSHSHSMDTHVAMSDKAEQKGNWLGLLKGDLSSNSGEFSIDGMSSERPWPPYDKIRSPTPTEFSKDRPVREVRLTLDGDMERYVWFLNQKPLSESDSIEVKQGEVVRFIMINRTMMHHPMHLHGHFFRVLNKHGKYSPLKHTVDVAPMSTTVIEFDANEFGDWFFHCHLLYHMESGMARVVHYKGFELDPALAAVRSNLYGDEYYLFGQVDGMSNMAQGAVTVANSRHIFSAEWQAGWQEVNDVEWEVIPTYDHYINRFSTVFLGADFEGAQDLGRNVGVLGVRYLLPLNIESRSWIDTDVGFQFALGKSFDLTPTLMPYGEFEFDTEERWEIRSGLRYMLSRDTSLVGQWHNEFGWGGGVEVRF